MRTLMALVAVAVVAAQGCSSGPTPEEQEKKRTAELNAVRADADAKVDAARADFTRRVADLEKAMDQRIAEVDKKLSDQMAALKVDVSQKFADLEQRYAAVMQMEQNAKKAVEEAQKMTKVNDIVRRWLQELEKSGKDQARVSKDLQQELGQ